MTLPTNTFLAMKPNLTIQLMTTRTSDGPNPIKMVGRVVFLLRPSPSLSLSPFRVVKIEKWPRRDWIVKASRGDASACASAVYLVIREALQERYFHLVLGSYRSNVVGVGGYKQSVRK